MGSEATRRGDFDLNIGFAEGRAVIAVQGAVDPLDAPELAAILDAVVEHGRRFVVVDLAHCDLISAPACRALALVAERLHGAGGALSIRAPSPAVATTLDVTGLGHLIRSLDRPRPEPRPDWAEEARRSRARAHLADQLSLDPENTAFHLVDRALRLVVTVTNATVGGADGVSVSLWRRGVLQTVAASDRIVASMDAEQYDTREGPCIDASITGRVFHVESLELDSRWPLFSPRAQALGIRSILSSPLQSDELPVGALNIYSRTASAFAVPDQERAALIATEASTFLTDSGLDTGDERQNRPFSQALRARQVVAQAEGILMARQGVNQDGAYGALGRMAVEAGTTLFSQAEMVVASTRTEEGPQPAPESGGRHG